MGDPYEGNLLVAACDESHTTVWTDAGTRGSLGGWVLSGTADGVMSFSGCQAGQPEMVSAPSEPGGNHGVLASLEVGGRDLVGGNLWAGRTLLRGAFPSIAVATLIPMALFYLTLAAGSIVWAIGVSVLYAYGFAAFQYRWRRRVSGMLLMTVFMVTVRAVSAMASGHSVVYFAIPVAETAGFGLMFVATMWTSQPLIVRLARDLVPHLADDLATRRALIRGLSLIWMVTYLASGATTLTLLTTVSLPVYLGAHQLAGWCWVGGGVALSLSLCRRRGVGLLAATLAGPGVELPPSPILVAPSRTGAEPPVLATL